MTRNKNVHAVTPGFTLTKLLAVIVHIAARAVMSFLGPSRVIEKGRNVKTMAQFRDFQLGMSFFEVDHKSPPIPRSRRVTGWDTIYGGVVPLAGSCDVISLQNTCRDRLPGKWYVRLEIIRDTHCVAGLSLEPVDRGKPVIP